MMSNRLPPSSLAGKRKRKKEPNPNPLFCQWLAEWRDEAKEKGWKSEYIYSKALNSLKKFPLPLSTGKECKILQNFGDKICKMLDDRLLKHKQEQEVATNVVRVTHSVSDSEEDEAGQAPPPQRPARRGGARQPREYVPAYRSGPYAILLTLYRQAQDPNFRGFMTKAELCRAAQPLSDKSFTVADPGSRYTAWSSVSILVRKGFLTKESSPAKYRLTDEGCELSHRLEEVERQNAAGLYQDGGDGAPHDPGGEGGADGPGRGDNGQGPVVADCYPDIAVEPVDHEAKKKSQKKKPSQNKDPDTAVKVIAASSSSTADQTHEGVDQEIPSRPEDNHCILVEDDGDGNKDDSDDELPVLTLPSLAERLKASSSSSSSSSTSLPTSREPLRNRKLQYWYVAEDDKLITRKDQARVEIDNETGVSFLVKINYQHLLHSGSLYRLDMTRPLGDDFVFVYLSDLDCYEKAEPPRQTAEPTTATTTTTTAAALAKPLSAASVRSSSAVTKSRRTHDISDSDSDSEQASQSELAGACSNWPVSGVHSLSSAVSNQKTSTVRSAAGSTTDAGSSIKFPRVPSLSSSQDSVGSGKSTASSTVEDFVLWPGTFDVVLCVDNREFYGGQSSSKSLLPDLIKSGVTCDLRLLNVGDLLWVAREKALPPGGGGWQQQPPLGMMGKDAQPARRELVLNYVVERKRMDDLVSSMTGGRLKEQKFRLKHSGLQEKIILIESYGSMQHFSISEDRVKQAIANTEIIDGFTVKKTGDSKETAAYLTLMTRYLQSYYQNKTLRSCSRDCIRELGIKFDVSDTEQMLMPFDHFNQASLKNKFDVSDTEQMLMPFDHLNQASLKNKPLTVMELFAKQLIQLWGMSAEKAKAIVDRYPTPTRLFEAYAACTSEKERDSLLASLKFGQNLRNLGIALSRQVAQLYTSKTLT
ncbi:hypothetical protein ACOMHN_034809 [Nucella lapillus]